MAADQVGKIEERHDTRIPLHLRRHAPRGAGLALDQPRAGEVPRPCAAHRASGQRRRWLPHRGPADPRDGVRPLRRQGPRRLGPHRPELRIDARHGRRRRPPQVPRPRWHGRGDHLPGRGRRPARLAQHPRRRCLPRRRPGLQRLHRRRVRRLRARPLLPHRRDPDDQRAGRDRRDDALRQPRPQGRHAHRLPQRQGLPDRGRRRLLGRIAGHEDAGHDPRRPRPQRRSRRARDPVPQGPGQAISPSRWRASPSAAPSTPCR